MSSFLTHALAYGTGDGAVGKDIIRQPSSAEQDDAVQQIVQEYHRSIEASMSPADQTLGSSAMMDAPRILTIALLGNAIEF